MFQEYLRIKLINRVANTPFHIYCKIQNGVCCHPEPELSSKEPRFRFMWLYAKALYTFELPSALWFILMLWKVELRALFLQLSVVLSQDHIDSVMLVTSFYGRKSQNNGFIFILEFFSSFKKVGGDQNCSRQQNRL